MPRSISNLLILLSPFILMVCVNEYSRSNLNEEGYYYHGVSGMNSGKVDRQNCTWYCHNATTAHCIKLHRKLIQPGFPFYKQIDKLYWGIIDFNSEKVNGVKVSAPKYYGAMNLIFLVCLWPLSMYLLLLNFLRLRRKIKALKTQP